MASAGGSFETHCQMCSVMAPNTTREARALPISLNCSNSWKLRVPLSNHKERKEHKEKQALESMFGASPELLSPRRRSEPVSKTSRSAWQLPGRKNFAAWGRWSRTTQARSLRKQPAGPLRLLHAFDTEAQSGQAHGYFLFA